MREELRIEDENACSLAAELVELTGESLEYIVVSALRDRFEREQARKAWQDHIMVITREIATSAREPAGMAMAG